MQISRGPHKRIPQFVLALMCMRSEMASGAAVLLSHLNAAASRMRVHYCNPTVRRVLTAQHTL